GRRALEDFGVFAGRHPVDRLRRHVHGLARLHLAPAQLSIHVRLEENSSRVQEDRLVLLVVVLQAQGVALVHVNELADVPVGLRPVELVAPRLLDARNLPVHDVTPLVSLPIAAASSRSISSTVDSRRTRRASARRSSARVSRSTCLATGIAPGVMLNSVSPRPTSSARSAGSDAISPHRDTGMPRRTAARRTITIIRRIAGW